MKLRYQMRGLGIGIFVTALLMGIATEEGRPLTDAEIKAKAYELGMVDGESIRLTDFRGTPQPPQGTSSPNATAGPKGTSAPKETASPQETAAPKETAAPQNTALPQETAAPQQSGNNSSGQAATIVISSGANSYSVSVQLAEAGLVENAEAFDSYLCNYGYAVRLRVGSYQITPGTSEEEIAKIITGSAIIISQ